MPRVFRHRLRVRYGECDPQGVVFNANYLAYFDVALTELWREAFGSYDAMLAEGTDLVVADARLRYLSPALFDDELELELVVARLGTTAMTTRIAVRRGREPLVEGEMRHVFVDPETRLKKDIPAHIRSGLEPYADAGAAQAAPG